MKLSCCLILTVAVLTNHVSSKVYLDEVDDNTKVSKGNRKAIVMLALGIVQEAQTIGKAALKGEHGIKEEFEDVCKFFSRDAIMSDKIPDGLRRNGGSRAVWNLMKKSYQLASLTSSTQDFDFIDEFKKLTKDDLKNIRKNNRRCNNTKNMPGCI